MTQADMAFLCNVSPRTYKYWEGKEIPRYIRGFLELLGSQQNREMMFELALANANVLAAGGKVDPLAPPSNRGSAITRRKLLMSIGGIYHGSGRCEYGQKDFLA